MSDSAGEDVLDLFPEDGDMFSQMELEKKATPKKNIFGKQAPTRITPIEFNSSDFQDENNPEFIGDKVDSVAGNSRLGVAVTGGKRKITSRLGSTKQPRWNNFPYPKNDVPKHAYNLISTPFNRAYSESPPRQYHSSSPLPPFVLDYSMEPEPKRFYNNDAFDTNIQHNTQTHPMTHFPVEPNRFPPHDSNPYNLGEVQHPNFFDESCNPNPYAPTRFGREKMSISINQRDFDYLNECVKEKNALKAWNKFDEIITTSSICIPLIILLDFIALLCQPDTLNNWHNNPEKPNQILSRLVHYLHRNNFKDITVYDGIMYTFSRIPVNEDLFRCLDLLKYYHPSRRTLLSILNAYARAQFTNKLLDLFQVIEKHKYFDPEVINAFFASIRTILIPKRDQVIHMLSQLNIHNISLPHESFSLIVQSFIEAGDIGNALLVIPNSSTISKMENAQIETIIMKCTSDMIPKVLNFVEKLDDNQRSVISPDCYTELFEKSISFNYPYGVGFLFTQFVNFNKLIETGLITQLLEFLFKYNHTFQLSEIFKTLEAFKDSNNSLTNIFLPPTMHKITQMLAQHRAYKELYRFVIAMFNEKIVPLKPVIKCLTHHLAAEKEESKLKNLFECANQNDLVFDSESVKPRKSPSKPVAHYVIDAKSPTIEKKFDITALKDSKPAKIDILITSIDKMVNTNMPPDHIFNHLLVSLGQSSDAFNSFKFLLEAFIPRDPHRPSETKSITQHILIRTAMRVSTNFAFVQNWLECIRFLSLLNKSTLFNIAIDETYSKELFHFLISIIKSSINENDFKEVFITFDKLNWPVFTLFDQGDLTHYKTELFALYKHCIEQVDLHNAFRTITYILQDKTDKNAKSGFSQLISITSNMGETSIALPLFNFMTTNKIDVSLDHLIYQKLITFLGQENKLQQAKLVFQHGVDNSCYTAMLSIMANPHQINLYSTLVPLEIKFILEKRLVSLYNMHKDTLTQVNSTYKVKPFEISFYRNTQTTNRTAFQESIRSFIIMLSEEFTPPLIDNCSEYLKNINYLKYYKMQISAIKLRQYLRDNFVPEKEKPVTITLLSESESTIQNGKNFTLPSTYKPQFLNQSPPKSPSVKIKEEPIDPDDSIPKTPRTAKKMKSASADWFSEVKRNINSKLSKYYWTGPITTKEDYNITAKRVIKMFRENSKFSQSEIGGVVTTDQNELIDSLIAEEISKIVK